MMRLRVSIVILSIWILFAYRLKCEKQEDYVIKIYKLTYDVGDNGFLAPNYSCALKAVNRHTGTINIQAWTMKDLKNITIHIQLFKFYSQFRPYLLNVTFNYCDTMSHKFFPNFYTNFLMRALQNKTNVLHECPVRGYIYFKDVALDASKLRLPIVLGKYKLIVGLYEGEPMKLIVELAYFADAYIKPPPRYRGKPNEKPELI